MKIPGPDHPITVAPARLRVRARAHEHVIADTDEAVTLSEAGYPPVHYFPRAAVETGFLSESPTVTECPYKGRATHYSMVIDGEVIENCAWSYEDPYPAVEAIKGRIAFYPDKIEVYEVTEEELRHREHGERPPSHP